MSRLCGSGCLTRSDWVDIYIVGRANEESFLVQEAVDARSRLKGFERGGLNRRGGSVARSHVLPLRQVDCGQAGRRALQRSPVSRFASEPLRHRLIRHQRPPVAG